MNKIALIDEVLGHATYPKLIEDDSKKAFEELILLREKLIKLRKQIASEELLCSEIAKRHGMIVYESSLDVTQQLDCIVSLMNKTKNHSANIRKIERPKNPEEEIGSE